MPIYEYRCESCGHQLEALQKMNDPALTDCPECKQAALKKIISAAGFRPCTKRLERGPDP